MSSNDWLICVAGWEFRHVAGIKRGIEKHSPARVTMLYFEEYSDRTTENRVKIEALCKEGSIHYEEVSLHFSDPTHNWNALFELFKDNYHQHSSLVMDITTSPRETIWNVLYLAKTKISDIKYMYHRPERYSTWLSQEPIEPRLVYKQSGIMRLGVPTALLVVTGFDSERTVQLIDQFEPTITLLGVQVGDQYENNRNNIEKHQEDLRGYADIDIFEVDAYSKDHGLSVIENKIISLLDEYNIIAASLGPKTTAISLFKLNAKYPQIALAYTPSREFNSEYSIGIGQTIEGTV